MIPRRLAHAAAVLLLALTLASGRVPAAGAADRAALYEGRVAVADRSDESRPEALERALAQVLSKLTGRREVDPATARPVLERAPELMQQFQYRDAGDGTSELSVRFDRDAVDAAVADAGLARWDGRRPAPLVWLAVRDADGRSELVGSDGHDDALARALEDAAWRRGLPLRHPLLDLEDRIKLRAEDVFGGARERVLEASSRYGFGPVAIVRVSASGSGTWSSEWTLIDGDAESRWASEGGAASAAIARGVDALADRVVERHAVDHTAALETAMVTVSGVRTLADYGRVVSYLRAQPALSSLSVAQTRGDDILFRVELRGGLDALRRITSLDGVLLGTSDPARFQLGR